MTLNPAAPSRALAPSTRTVAKISARWREWCPAIRIWAQSTGFGLTEHTGAILRGQHKDWLLSLLSASVEMRIIRRLDLDDPRLPISMLRLKLAEYQQRSRLLRSQRPSRRQ